MHITFPWLSLLPPHSEALVGLAPSSQVDLCLVGVWGPVDPTASTQVMRWIKALSVVLSIPLPAGPSPPFALGHLAW